MRKWRLNQSLVDPRKGPLRHRKRKPFPGLTLRMGPKEFTTVKERVTFELIYTAYYMLMYSSLIVPTGAP